MAVHAESYVQIAEKLLREVEFEEAGEEIEGLLKEAQVHVSKLRKKIRDEQPQETDKSKSTYQVIDICLRHIKALKKVELQLERLRDNFLAQANAERNRGGTE